jgi:hypothetical protein
MHLSNDSLRRKIWLDQACKALLDYRSPGIEITETERQGLAAYLDAGISAADAAELYQAAQA